MGSEMCIRDRARGRHRGAYAAVKPQRRQRQVGKKTGKLACSGAADSPVPTCHAVTPCRRCVAGQPPGSAACRRDGKPRRQPGPPQKPRHVGKKRPDPALKMRRAGNVEPQPVAGMRDGGPPADKSGADGIRLFRRRQRAITAGPARQMQQIGRIGGRIAVTRDQFRAQRPRIGKPHAGMKAAPARQPAHRFDDLGTMAGAGQDKRHASRHIPGNISGSTSGPAQPFGRQVRKPGMDDKP